MYFRNIPSALPVIGNYFSSFLNDVDHETQQVVLTNILFLQLEINEEIRNLAVNLEKILEQKSGISLEFQANLLSFPLEKNTTMLSLGKSYEDFISPDEYEDRKESYLRSRKVKFESTTHYRKFYKLR